jgi:putative FmdB family regulatory protein
MPLQDYHCIDCEHEQEELIRSEADIPHRCPACDSEKYERTMSAPGMIRGNFGTPRKKGN